MEAIIDRIEGDKAVIILSNSQQFIIPVGELPADAGEGTVLIISFATDKDKERERRKEIEKLQRGR